MSAIPAKIRNVGGVEHIVANLKVLAEVEHNRWNVEKLLMGFRPTTDEEHKLVKADAKKRKSIRIVSFTMTFVLSQSWMKPQRILTGG